MMKKIESSFRNIRIVLEYDGTDFCGWQIQKTGKSIQGTIQETLEKITGEKIKLIGSGRTDAGVHAIGQVAHFKTQSKIPLLKIKKSLNSLLSPSIVIRKIEEVSFDFHAQISAKRKQYVYFILSDELSSPFLDRYCWQIKQPLNWKKMREALKILKGKQDFKSFQSVGTPVKSTIREIYKIEIKKISSRGSLPLAPTKNLYQITLEANGFLKQMVRNIVGALVELGKGKNSTSELKQILKAKDRRKAGLAAPAKGLFLVKVHY